MTAFEIAQNPKISIIIPVYNVKQYLCVALDSVINQTYKNLEIIIVDDGSDDGSEKICDDYAQKDPRIKLIHQKNAGLSGARNTGLDNMTGDYVAFLDSDDAFLPDTIEKSITAILSKDVDCVVFKRVNCKTSKDGKLKISSMDKIIPSLPHGVYTRNDALKLAAVRKINAAVWNKFSKREIWENLRFPENHVYEDIYIILQFISNAKKIYIADDAFVLYRIRNNSITSTVSAKNVDDLLDSWSVFVSFIKTNTPVIFDEEQLGKVQKIVLTDLLYRYSKFLSSKMSSNTDLLLPLVQKILELEKIVKINNCSLKVRILYFFALKHPKFLSIFFTPCFAVYKILGKLFRMIK